MEKSSESSTMKEEPILLKKWTIIVHTPFELLGYIGMGMIIYISMFGKTNFIKTYLTVNNDFVVNQIIILSIFMLFSGITFFYGANPVSKANSRSNQAQSTSLGYKIKTFVKIFFGLLFLFMVMSLFSAYPGMMDSYDNYYNIGPGIIIIITLLVFYYFNYIMLNDHIPSNIIVGSFSFNFKKMYFGTLAILVAFLCVIIIVFSLPLF